MFTTNIFFVYNKYFCKQKNKFQNYFCMIQEVPIEIFSFVGVSSLALVGIVWGNLNEKIKTLQDNEKTCPIHTVKKDIAEMKTDIKWLITIIEKK